MNTDPPELHPTAFHPMLKQLILLEQPRASSSMLDADVDRLIAYALTCGDYWAGLAIDWLLDGHHARSHRVSLREFCADQKRPQKLRHRAYGISKQNEDHDRRGSAGT